jgi:helix-hairpin-helix protein
MPSHRSSRVRTPAAEDDLTRISGVGSAVARSLRAAGFRTYRDVEASTTEELAAAVVGLPACSAARIDTMDWIGQARRLGSKSVEAGAPAAPAAAPADDAQPILEVARLGTARIRSLDMPLSAGEPPAVALELRPGPGPAPAATLDYSAEITARRLDADGDAPVARMAGVVQADRGISHASAGPVLRPGLYRFVAAVTLYPAGHGPDDKPVGSVVADGDLVQVVAGATSTEPPRKGRPAVSRRLVASGAITEDEYAALTAVPPS